MTIRVASAGAAQITGAVDWAHDRGRLAAGQLIAVFDRSSAYVHTPKGEYAKPWIHIDLAAIAAAGGARFPATGLFLPAQLLAVVRHPENGRMLVPGIGSVPTRVTLDDRGRVRRAELVVHGARVTIDFSGYGTAVDVSQPPADQVLDLTPFALELTRGGRIFDIPSSAMEPTLHCARPAFSCVARTKDHIATHPLRGTAVRRGDIVVFTAPPPAAARCGAGGTFVKRVVGLPGERWSERAGRIELDGRVLREPYIRADRRDTDSYEGGRIPPGRYLLLGDNRAQSCDSRLWGSVPRRNLIGRVVLILRGTKLIRISGRA
jgi:signal peptidase I